MSPSRETRKSSGFDRARRHPNFEDSLRVSQMLKSSGALGAATLASRVLGLVREMVYARFMGNSWVADAFMLAFTVPNLFRRLLGEGALSAAFIPMFKEKEKLAGDAEMWRAANAVISALVASAAVVVGLGVAVLSVLLMVGVAEGKTLLMLKLLRVMFPYVLLVCVAAVCIGMLNARGHFFVPALGAASLNLVMIASVLWLAPRLGATLPQQIFGLAIGVLAAGVIQAAFQLPLLRTEGFRFRWVSPWRDEAVRRVVRQMIPGIVGVAAYQINVLITQSLGFWVENGIVSSFNYAVRLMELPQGVFGLSLATYLLPTLSGLAAEKKYPEFRQTLGQGLSYLTLINLLASVLLVALAEPIVRLLFEGRQFDAAATHRSARALMFLAAGLLAFSTVNNLARAFFALGDTRTPMRISVFCLALNAVVSALLVWPMKEAGLALANTLTSMVNVTLLAHALRRKLARLEWQTLRRHFPAMLGAAVCAGALAWWLANLWGRRWGHDTVPLRLGEVFLPMLAGTLVYFGLNWWLKVPFLQECLAQLPGRRRSGS